MSSKFYRFVEQPPLVRAAFYHRWADECRDSSPDIALEYDVTAAELEAFVQLEGEK